VKIEPYADLTEVDGTTVVMNRLHSGEPLVFEDVDTLVLDFGWEPETPVEPAVRAMFPSAKLFRVGDNLAPRGLQAAVWDGAALRLRV
jgi:hypothetical protein